MSAVSKRYKVEYLTTIDTTDNHCDTTESFRNMLQSRSTISVADDKITFENIKFDLVVIGGELKEKNRKYYHLTIESPSKNLSKFKKMLKLLRKTLSESAGKKPVEVLWDDVSAELAEKAYPIIHSVENQMRKLITKFMLINVGTDWTDKTIPDDAKVAETKKGSKHSNNYLHGTDFIQLSHLLFKKYTAKEAPLVLDKLKDVTGLDEISVEELHKLIPRSNWERYFDDAVNCTSEDLETLWKQLYELRCKVAHNNHVNDDEYDQILDLVTKAERHISTAIDKLDKVEIPDDEIATVLENMDELLVEQKNLSVDNSEEASVLQKINDCLDTMLCDVDSTFSSRCDYLEFLVSENVLTRDEVVAIEVRPKYDYGNNSPLGNMIKTQRLWLLWRIYKRLIGVAE